MSSIICSDCWDAMRQMPDQSVDLTFGSPPYEAARSYGIGFNLKGQEWVDWMVARVLEAVRVTRGLTAFVIDGRTSDFQWTATPALLMADLHRIGIKLRKPPIFHRVGIPGSGGPEWLRNDYEFIVCCSHGRLPWSNNKALGKPPKYGPGGGLSHRSVNGDRVHGRRIGGGGPAGYKNGDVKQGPGERRPYYGVDVANPGNVIHCSVGGGKMGSLLSHKTEAPFPEKLAEFFILSFCPPGGVVLDPFSGSGTTAAMAAKHCRDFIAIDIRKSQCELTKRRLEEVQSKLVP